MTQNTDESAFEVLGRLVGAEPSRSVHNRIVRGALVRASKPRHRWRWIAGVSIANATALLLVWAVWVRSPAHQPIGAGFVHTPEVAAARYSIGHSELDVSAGADLRVERATSKRVSLLLTAGRLVANVEPLAPGRSFEVRSPHGVVRVVGTRFAVEVRDCTYVSVSKGTVLIEGDTDTEARRVSSGQQQALCPRDETLPIDHHGRAWVREAIDLINRGEDPDAATRLLERYLETYPSGLFAEEAMFHLVFLLESRGRHPEAASMVTRFLETFPNSRRSNSLRDLREGLSE